MQNVNYWKQFESTGRIEDYLTYCSYASQAYNRERNTSVDKKESAGQLGANSYAGIHKCNGNCAETDAYR